jgi:hypothetical protein
MPQIRWTWVKIGGMGRIRFLKFDLLVVTKEYLIFCFKNKKRIRWPRHQIFSNGRVRLALVFVCIVVGSELGA